MDTSPHTLLQKNIRKVEYEVAQRLTSAGGQITWSVDGVQLDFPGLLAIKTAEDRQTIETAELKVKAVHAGERLISIYEEVCPDQGNDTNGNEPTDDPLPVVGDNVRFNTHKNCFEASIYGYLMVIEGKISVMPPVWIAPSLQEVYYLNLAQASPASYPTQEDIESTLALLTIQESCALTCIIQKLCRDLPTDAEQRKTIKIAEANMPQDGEDAQIKLYIDTEKKAGAALSDGSLNMRERNIITSVQKGTLLAKKNLATTGYPGTTLFGKEIKQAPGRDIKIKAASGVTVVEHEDEILYFSATEGNVTWRNNELSVSDVFQVNGDVGYETGNIDVKTDLLIKGSVLPGFTVKALGNIKIHGAVENGAIIAAGGNLWVEKGIIGEDTRAAVVGDLTAAHIQDADIIVKGRAVISSYLFNANLKAGGAITVLKKQGERSGRIVGGVASSSVGVELSICGNPGNTHTVIAIAPNQDHIASKEKLEESQQDVKDNIAKISRTIPVKSIDAISIKAYLDKISPDQKAAIIKLLTNFSKLIKYQKKIVSKLQHISEKEQQLFKTAKIIVEKSVYQGSEIQFGKHSLRITQDIEAAKFKLEQDKIVISTA